MARQSCNSASGTWSKCHLVITRVSYNHQLNFRTTSDFDVASFAMLAMDKDERV